MPQAREIMEQATMEPGTFLPGDRSIAEEALAFCFDAANIQETP
jgi:hypothetical protein